MDKLSLILIQGSAEKFKINNQDFIKGIEKTNDIRVLFCTDSDHPGTSEYERVQIAVNKLKSEYIAFADESTQYVLRDLAKLRTALKEHRKYLSVRVRDKKDSEEYSCIIDPRFPMFYPRYIFSTSFVKSVLLANEETHFYMDRLIIEAADSDDYNLIDYRINCLADEKLETKSARYEAAFNKEWYIDEMEKLILPKLRAGASFRSKQLMLYMIWRKYWNNRSIFDKKILSAAEIAKLDKLTEEALNLIEDEVIFDERTIQKMGLQYCHYMLLKRGKSDFDYRIKCDEEENLQYYVNGLYCGNNIVKAHVYAINVENTNLKIDFLIYNDYFELVKTNRIKVIAGGKEYLMNPIGISNTINIFGMEAIARSFYNVEIPLDNIKKQIVEFSLLIDGVYHRLPMNFKKTAARLTAKSQYSKCVLDGYLLRYKKETIIVRRNHRHFAGDTLFEKDIFKIRKSRKSAIAAIGLRQLYRVGRYKTSDKPVWIFFDKLYKGGDNGEHLFRYAYENVKYAESYYIIREDTEDYKELSKVYGDHILPYNTLSQKLMVLYADIIFATHANAFKFCGFGPTLQECLRGELSAKIVCIQHGLTIQDMPQFQNRLVDNTRAYFCASPVEVANLIQPMYGYDKSELHLTGLPRYDGLHSNDKKQILIAPTWRRDIVISGNKTGDSKEYNPRFKETEYYHIYNNLIHNEKLIECARENGYTIVYLLHPTVGAQKSDFEETEGVMVINGAEASYEKHLSESSIMITDYSGIQFDFAYMMKPVIYYHPEELPPQYENSHFSYEDDGFGPIITKQYELVDMLCSSMENECVMDEEYKKRVTDFFAYTDHDNCKRICETIESLFYK